MAIAGRPVRTLMSGQAARNRVAGVSRRRIAAAGAGGVLAAAMVAAVAGPAAAAGSPVLAFTPSPFHYGQVLAGHTAAHTFTLANTGGTASPVLSVTLAGSAEFTITANTCTGTSLGPHKSCTVTVRFAPASTGEVTSTLTAANNHTALATDALTGTGVPVGHIYWANTGPGTMGKANLNGTDVNQNLITLPAGIAPFGVAVNASHIYWTNGSQPGFSTIGEANLNGTDANENLITFTGSGDSDPDWVAVDASHIYWVSQSTTSSGINTIGEANLNGTDANENLITFTGSAIPSGVAVSP